MATDTNQEKTPTMQEFHTSKSGDDNKMDRAAEELAVKSSKTEKRYDRRPRHLHQIV